MEQNKQRTLANYKDKIHSCSKCGLCQAVCPVFQVTGNECTVSRGQFIMLDGIVRGKLKLNKNINKYLDLCLKCNKCSEFCPSDIDVVDILLCAKYEYFKKSLEGKIYGFLESKFIFNTILNIPKFLTRPLNNYKSKKFDTKAVYFGGCISNFTPNLNKYVIKLLNSIKIEVVPANLNCCGMPFLTTGNLDRFIENMQENIKKLPDDIDYIITDCASCEWIWGKYKKYADAPELKEKLDRIKIKNIYELISENNLQFESKNRYKLTYHKPCHEHCSDSIEIIIKNIKNTEYIELDGKNECCGFGAFEHPQTLKTILPVLKSKKMKIKSTKADFVLTTCVGCLVNLNFLLVVAQQKAKRLLSFLKDSCIINKTL